MPPTIASAPNTRKSGAAEDPDVGIEVSAQPEDLVPIEGRFSMVPELLGIDTTLPDRCLRVWVILDRIAKGRITINITRKQLAVACGCGTTSLDEAIKALTSAGWVTAEVRKDRGLPNKYQVNRVQEGSRSGVKGFPAEREGVHGIAGRGFPAGREHREETTDETVDTSRLAPSSPENEDPVQRVSTTTQRQPKQRGKLRAVPDPGGPDEGRMVGRRGTTEKAIRTRAARERIGQPNSGGGLAEEFKQRAVESGNSGPQEVNGPALARSLTAWMRSEQNPDSPEAIRAMFDAFFTQPGGSTDFPLWRRFLSEAPKLRAKWRKAQPVDWKAAYAASRRQIEIDAANGDIRAQKALTGENMPWTQDWQAKLAEQKVQQEAEQEAARQAEREAEAARRKRTSRRYA